MSNPFSSIKGGRMPQMRAPMVVLDRFGKMVEAGHLVLFHNNVDLVFEVTDVRPVLNPAMQAKGVTAMQVTLVATVPVQYAAGQQNMDLTVVGESRARAAARAGNNGNAEAPAEAPAADPPASSIVLTDAAEPPASVPAGPCNECGCIGPVGQTCPECGVGTYESGTPTLGDA